MKGGEGWSLIGSQEPLQSLDHEPSIFRLIGFLVSTSWLVPKPSLQGAWALSVPYSSPWPSSAPWPGAD